MKTHSEFAAAMGSVLTALREERNLSQYKLAELSGCSRQHIIKMEKGRQEARLSTLFQIAAALGYSLEQLGAAFDKGFSEHGITHSIPQETDNKK